MSLDLDAIELRALVVSSLADGWMRVVREDVPALVARVRELEQDCARIASERACEEIRAQKAEWRVKELLGELQEAEKERDEAQKEYYLEHEAHGVAIRNANEAEARVKELEASTTLAEIQRIQRSASAEFDRAMTLEAELQQLRDAFRGLGETNADLGRQRDAALTTVKELETKIDTMQSALDEGTEIISILRMTIMGAQAGSQLAKISARLWIVDDLQKWAAAIRAQGVSEDAAEILNKAALRYASHGDDT